MKPCDLLSPDFYFELKRQNFLRKFFLHNLNTNEFVICEFPTAFYILCGGLSKRWLKQDRVRVLRADEAVIPRDANSVVLNPLPRLYEV